MNLANLYKGVAADRAARWGYAETLDADNLADWIRKEAADAGLQDDVNTVLRLLAAGGDRVAESLIHGPAPIACDPIVPTPEQAAAATRSITRAIKVSGRLDALAYAYLSGVISYRVEAAAEADTQGTRDRHLGAALAIYQAIDAHQATAAPTPADAPTQQLPTVPQQKGASE